MPAPVLALPDELLEKIFTLLPPDDPKILFHASAVCRPWRTLITDPAFGSRYRKFHGTPPLLGFFEEDHTFGTWFTPLSTPTSPVPPVHPVRCTLRPRDSRHGLVLLENFDDPDDPDKPTSFVVWDPTRRRQWELPCPEFSDNLDMEYDVAVVCAANGCSHLDCHGGPFAVAFVGTNYNDDFTYACLYSSEARTWSPISSCKWFKATVLVAVAIDRSKVLVGNALYFACVPGGVVVRYDLVRRDLSMFGTPYDWTFPDYDLITTADGVLGLAYVESRQRLCLWLMEVGPDGTEDFAEHPRVIELQELLPPRPRSISNSLFVISCAEGAGVIFLNTTVGVFAIDLKSGRVKKVLTGRKFRVMPYMSFYTPDQARCIAPPSPMAFSMENIEAAQGEDHVSLLSRPSREASENEGKWEDDTNKEEETGNEGEKSLEQAQELFDKGSKAIKEGDAFATKYLDDALEIRMAYHGTLALSCVNTYYEYGYSLLVLCKSRPKCPPYWERCNMGKNEVNLAWKLFHIARATLEKSPGSKIEKEEIDHALSFCSKALAILKRLIDPDLLQTVELNLYVCLALVFVSRAGYTNPYCAKIVLLCKSYIQNMKDACAAGEGASEKPSLDDEMKFLTELKKTLEGLEQEMPAKTADESNEEDVVVRSSTVVAQGAAPFVSLQWLHHEVAWAYLDDFVQTIPKRLRELIHHVAEVAATSLTL